ncbi:hypothetical protein [Paractinoplanes rishiriensis]|uniref:3-phosphoshikimate 1-carboxyvinyltransferase n=1 Tax=Paractinoplanes rishiriensis TaxID=1050105 RepID=A0A919KA79_9ACTN|nr:hypothetical protein [Actinoplanes rishiriensis]GIF01726.1 hypothetical protein Ari01nite_91900 [Actinoplanes rishiriensis]
MIKIVAGAERSDAGTVEFGGAPVTIGSTSDAIALGIATSIRNRSCSTS